MTLLMDRFVANPHKWHYCSYIRQSMLSLQAFLDSQGGSDCFLILKQPREAVKSIIDILPGHGLKTALG
jgi:hypothetical protein